MDSHKPLTAGEIEELNVAATKFAGHGGKGIFVPDAMRVFELLPRLLSLLTPPPDAAVREAVEMTQAEVDAKEKIFPGASVVTVGMDDLRTLLRAVQAARLGLSALFPDDFSDSKDWRDGDPAERIEWLKSMLTAMREREAEAWKQGELSPRLTGEQVEAVREAKEVFAISGDVKLANRLEAAFPELAGEE